MFIIAIDDSALPFSSANVVNPSSLPPRQDTAREATRKDLIFRLTGSQSYQDLWFDDLISMLILIVRYLIALFPRNLLLPVQVMQKKVDKARNRQRSSGSCDGVFRFLRSRVEELSKLVVDVFEVEDRRKGTEEKVSPVVQGK